MSLVSIIKDCLPPFLLRSLKLLFTHRKRYNTFSEALSASSSSKGYEDEYLVKTIFEETKEYEITLHKEYKTFIDQTIILNLLPFSLLKNKETLNILDIGGASGIHFYPIKKILGELYKFRWMIVETDALSKISKTLENDELKFFSNIETAVEYVENIDLIIASGSIQYFESPKSVLTKICNLGAEYILLTRLSLTNSKKEIITVQKSLLSQNSFEILPKGFSDRIIKYPHTRMREFEFNSIILQNYEIKLFFTDESGTGKIRGGELGYGLLLQRKK